MKILAKNHNCLLKGLQSIILLVLGSAFLNAQVEALFDVDVTEGCTPLDVTFTNNSTTGINIIYEWNFGDGTTSELYSPAAKTYNNFNGTRTVTLVVTDTVTLETGNFSRDINVIQNPSAQLTIQINNEFKTNACQNEYVKFSFSYAQKDSTKWSFGDGEEKKYSGNYYPNPVYHKYTAQGSFPVQYITYYKQCSDTSDNYAAYEILVDGPIADFSLSADEACKGDTIEFRLGPTTGVTSTSYDLGDGTTMTGDIVKHSYLTSGYPIIKLTASGGGRTCIIEDTVHIFNVDAHINVSNPDYCDGKTVGFQNGSSGSDILLWSFGDGYTSVDNNPGHIYSTGNYTVELAIENTFGCVDTHRIDIEIKDPPPINVVEFVGYVCEGDSSQLEVSGGHVILWTPSAGLDSADSYTPWASPHTTTTYNATVTDTLTKCSTFGQITIPVVTQPEFDINLNPLTDVVVIGYTDTIHYEFDQEYLYTWQSTDTIISFNDSMLVAYPVIPRNDTAYYTLILSDTSSCFHDTSFVRLFVKEAYVLGLPGAFTPNGDFINDEIIVAGWGIKNLIEFRIFNRHGTEVFYTDDLDQGWDGTLDGKPMAADTYIYYIKAEMWDDNITEKRGTFTLLK